MNCPTCKVELDMADRQGVVYRGNQYRQPYYGKKKKSFLGEMFDFDEPKG